MKTIFQASLAAVILCVYCMALPQRPNNEYLPPDGGYRYDAPSVSLPSPQPTYSPLPTYRPRPPSPSTLAPLYSTSRPYIPPRIPSYEQSGSAISPVGNDGAGTGGGEFDHLRTPHVPGMPFEFNYVVKDDAYGTDYNHQATSNGDQVRGEYRVLLPDGRTQIVKYIADWKDGFTADVTYQGEAQYPQPGLSGSNIAGVGYRPPFQGYPSPSQGYPSPSPGYPTASRPSPSYSPTVPQPVSSLGYPSRPAYSGSGYNTAQQPGPAIPSYPSPSTARPTASLGYDQQPVSGYNQQAITGYGGSPSSPPPPSYSSTSDYGSYKK